MNSKNGHKKQIDFQALVENSRDMFYRMSLPSLEYDYISPAIKTLLGYEPSEFYDNPGLIIEIVHPDFQSYFAQQKDNLLKGDVPSTYEFQVFDKTGQIKWVHQRNVLILDEQGNPIAIEGIVTDVSEQKEIEHTLQRRDRQLRRLIESNVVPISFTNNKGEIYEANEAFFHLIGYERREMETGLINWKKLTPQEYLYLDERAMAELNEKNSCTPFEKEYIRKDGSRVPVLLCSAVLEESRNDYVAFTIDLTEQKKVENRLQEMHFKLERKVEERTKELKIAKDTAEEANKAKSEFLANISHELRNPMHHILSYSKYGIEKILTAEKNKLEHYFRQIRTSGSRLMVLLNDLLDLSKLESGKMEYTFDQNNLNEIILETLDEFHTSARDRNIDILYSPPQESALIRCDSFKISQVIRNLLSNAVKFSPDGGSIVASLELTGSGNDGRNHAKLAIQDQGVGVPDSEKTLIFEKFTQSSLTKTGAGGSGLGLAICNEIVKAHGGKIWVEDVASGGSIFIVLLPLIAD